VETMTGIVFFFQINGVHDTIVLREGTWGDLEAVADEENKKEANNVGCSNEFMAFGKLSDRLED